MATGNYPFNPYGEPGGSRSVPTDILPSATNTGSSYTPGGPTGNSASVSERVTGLMTNQNPLMRGARTRGAQASNRRGLLNSSMGVQAGEAAAYDVALPIASQEAAQAHQGNLQASEFQQQERLTGMNLASADRQNASNLAAAFENSYAQTVSNIMNNTEMPGSVRKQYLDHAGRVRDSNLRLVEQMYGINLEWGDGSGSGGGGTPSSGNGIPDRPQPPDLRSLSGFARIVANVRYQQALQQWEKTYGGQTPSVGDAPPQNSGRREQIR